MLLGPHARPMCSGCREPPAGESTARPPPRPGRRPGQPHSGTHPTEPSAQPGTAPPRAACQWVDWAFLRSSGGTLGWDVPCTPPGAVRGGYGFQVQDHRQTRNLGLSEKSHPSSPNLQDSFGSLPSAGEPAAAPAQAAPASPLPGSPACTFQAGGAAAAPELRGRGYGTCWAAAWPTGHPRQEWHRGTGGHCVYAQTLAGKVTISLTSPAPP